MDIRGKCVVGALALATLVGAAGAQTVTRDLFYTRFQTPLVTDANVKRVTVSYSRTLPTTLGVFNITSIARTESGGSPGADGINFHPVDGDLLVGGQSTGRMFKVNRNTGAYTNVSVGQVDAFHVKVSPDGQRAYTAGLLDIFSQIAVVPLQPMTNGNGFPIAGSDPLITDIAFVPPNATFPNGRVFYTASGTGGMGHWGTIDLGPAGVGPFATTRLSTLPVDFAHGIQFDPFTNNLILVGEHQIAQINPYDVNPATMVVSVADFAATFPTLDLDQAAVDGTGLIYAAGNDGYLLVMDYAGDHLVGSVASKATAKNVFLDLFLDDIAPVVGQGANPCCEIGSGDFDGRDGQQSQLPVVGVSLDQYFDYRVADDFYLLPDRIYRINSIEGTLLTDANPSILPKAQLELYEDCDGLPSGNPIRIELQATSMLPSGIALGMQSYLVNFAFSDLWLKGGKSYWVSLIGKGASNPTERWFWGTAGGGDRATIRGRPGVYKSVSGGTPNWTPFIGPPCPTCIGCTDFAFCVHGTSCKILNDNGTYATAPGSGTLSLVNGSLTSAQTADDFLIPPCVSGRICYIEAYVASNCEAFRMSLFDNACASANALTGVVGGNLPASLTPFQTLIPDKVEQVTVGDIPVALGGIPVTMTFPNLPPSGGSVVLNVYRLKFWTPGLSLPDGHNYWLSAYGLITNNASQVAYFLFNQDCRRACLIRWQEGAIWGPRYQSGTPANPLKWVKGSSIFGTPHDYAFLVAVDDGISPFSNGQPQACPVDFNNSGDITPQDIFDYLNAWFAGCP